MLRELGYGDVVQSIPFKMGAIDDETYANKRAEIWSLMRDFIHREDGEVSIPDSDEVQTDLASMPKNKVNSSGQTIMVAKDTIREKYGMSPDIGDAMALTFSFPVRRESGNIARSNKFRRKTTSKSSLSTQNRVRGYNTSSRDPRQRS